MVRAWWNPCAQPGIPGADRDLGQAVSDLRNAGWYRVAEDLGVRCQASEDSGGILIRKGYDKSRAPDASLPAILSLAERTSPAWAGAPISPGS